MSDCAQCEEYREMLVTAEEANSELARQVAGLHGLLTRSGKTEVALRTELARQREEEPEAEAIRAVLNHWKVKLNHPKAKTPLGGERAKKVRARLRERFTVEDLKLAVDGCAKVPFVGAGGRRATGTDRERHDDLKLICQDESTVERFMRYAADESAPIVKPKAKAPGGPTGVDALLNRLENVSQVRLGQWTARCPAHDDRHASLSVAQGDKGAVVHCHTGCSVGEIARAAGLDVSALFDREDAPVARPKVEAAPLPTPEELVGWQDRLMAHTGLLGRLWDLRHWSALALQGLRIGFDGQRLVLPVHDQNGELVNALRYLPRRQGDERKLLALKGRPRDLFPPPERLEGDVWLVEGEPDAISGAELLLPTVAVPGTNGWRQAWAHRFAGRRVTVCFDCDEPGRTAAGRVLADLHGVTDAVTLDLEPERTDGYDLSDALLDGVDRDFLVAMSVAVISERVAA
jgi:hypothetical protein